MGIIERTPDREIFKALTTLAVCAGAVVTGLAKTVPRGSAEITIEHGLGVLGGSNPTVITTALTTIIAFTATLIGSAAPGVGTSLLTVTIAGGVGSVYAWKVTGSGDATLIASAGGESFSWIAIGY